MATILKLTDDERVLEVVSINEDNIITIRAGEEFDDQSWTPIRLNKPEIEDLIEFLQKQLTAIK